jgi:lipopolysaccharide/colanic/teichoic acid biosynthesis glycosyltransferase
MASSPTKRLLDLAIAGGTLLASAPLLGLLAAAVKLDSPGPALFAQTRVGRGGRPFRIYKLRTMRVTAPGPSITAAGDSRITRVGRLLRKTKLDELPQLWNVVRGDMSLVGPRPEVPEYVDHYRPEWRRLFSVRPGLTDLASVRFRDEERLLGLARDRERAYAEVVMPLKLQLALEGLEHTSVIDDVSVILQTALAIVRRPTEEDPILVEAARRIELINDEQRS